VRVQKKVINGDIPEVPDVGQGKVTRLAGGAFQDLVYKFRAIKTAVGL
jgi:hypothetical protein